MEKDILKQDIADTIQAMQAAHKDLILSLQNYNDEVARVIELQDKLLKLNEF